MRFAILLTLMITSVFSFSQTMFGDWDCQLYGIKLQLNADGTYIMSHAQGNSQGYYQIQGDQLWMKDQNAQQAIMYNFQLMGVDLVLNDQNGATLPFTRGKAFTQGPTAGGAILPGGNQTAQSGTLLAEQKGIQMYQSHFEVGINLTEFILGHKVTATERQQLKSKLIEEFNVKPAMVISQIQEIDQALRRLGTLTDPIQIGTARQQLYAALYLGTYQMQEHEKPLLIQVLNRYFKVFAIDTTNQLILTDKDASGMLNYLSFLSYCQGHPVQITPEYQQSFFNDITQQFQTMSLEQKQVLCSASLLWKLIETNWSQMTPAQQQQFVSSMNTQMGQQGYANVQPLNNNQSNSTSKKSIYEMQADFNAKQNMFTMMQNMNTNSHALSLNIIENIGGTGNYWEVTDLPY